MQQSHGAAPRPSDGRLWQLSTRGLSPKNTDTQTDTQSFVADRAAPADAHEHSAGGAQLAAGCGVSSRPDLDSPSAFPVSDFCAKYFDDLWKEIEKWAADELRSVNGQIEYVLRQAVGRRKADRPKDE